MHVQEMTRAHPLATGAGRSFARVIETAMDCAQVCASCADACLCETNVEGLRDCIELDLVCAHLCTATASVLSLRRGGDVAAGLLEACANACRLCEEECRKHADMHEHCRICAETCAECERACMEAARTTH